jgi:signal transduction histidine kinase
MFWQRLINVSSRLSIRFRLILSFITFFFLLFLTYSYFVMGTYKRFREQSYLERLKDNLYVITENIIESQQNNSDIDGVFSADNLGLFRLANSQGMLILDANYDTIFAYNAKPFYLNILPKEYGSSFEIIYNDTQFLFFTQTLNQKTYSIFGFGYNDVGIERYNALKRYSWYYLLAILSFIGIGGYIYASYLLQPLKRLLETMNSISDSNLHRRIELLGNNDEIDQVGKNFNHMLDRIQRSFQIEKNLVANSSHEFRTPLTAIKGQLDVALMKERTNDYYLKLIRSINDDINRLIGLQSALSELIKAEIETNRNAFKLIPIIEVVSDAKEYVKRAHSGYVVDLYVSNFPSETAESLVLADESLIRSAFINIIDNACKFSNPHMCKITLNFLSSFIEIKFEDNGSGIDLSDMPHVFEAFYRSRDQTHIQGYGIGLSLVKKVCDLHGIDVSINSHKGKGTSIVMNWPYYSSGG